MNRMRLWASAAIIAAVILVAFAFSVPHTRDIPAQTLSEAPAGVPAVTLHDSFKKGVHTISGSVETPNACTEVSVSASLIGSASSTQGILVAISMPPDTGVCLQVPSYAKFETTLSAPASLPLSVTVNGMSASTTPS